MGKLEKLLIGLEHDINQNYLLELSKLSFLKELQISNAELDISEDIIPMKNLQSLCGNFQVVIESSIDMNKVFPQMKKLQIGPKYDESFLPNLYDSISTISNLKDLKVNYNFEHEERLVGLQFENYIIESMEQSLYLKSVNEIPSASSKNEYTFESGGKIFLGNYTPFFSTSKDCQL
eukprot:403336266